MGDSSFERNPLVKDQQRQTNVNPFKGIPMKVLKSARTSTVIALLMMQIAFSAQTPAQAAFYGGGTSGSCNIVKMLYYQLIGVKPTYCVN